MMSRWLTCWRQRRLTALGRTPSDDLTRERAEDAIVLRPLVVARDAELAVILGKRRRGVVAEEPLESPSGRCGVASGVLDHHVEPLTFAGRDHSRVLGRFEEIEHEN